MLAVGWPDRPGFAIFSFVLMRCRGCGVGINIDTNGLANAAEEMRMALEKVPPEITVKFFR